MTPAGAYQVRALKLALELVSNDRSDVARELVAEAFSIAFEHCFWAAERGQTPEQTLSELGFDASPLTSWGDAHLRLTDLWLDEVWPRLRASSGRGGGGSSDHRESGAGQRGMCWSRRRRSRSRPTPHRSGGMNSAPLRPAI